MTDKPTDEDIVGAVRVWGGQCATYIIKNRLRSKGFKVQTPWVLRQMKRLERAGVVRRVPGAYAVMIEWGLCE